MVYTECKYMKHIFELRIKDQIEERSSQLLRNLSSSNICFIYLHSFIHPSRVYYELTIWPVSSWLDSSVGRALYRHRRGHGFESRSSLKFFFFFFRLSNRNCSSCVVTARIFLLFDGLHCCVWVSYRRLKVCCCLCQLFIRWFLIGIDITVTPQHTG